MLQSANDLKGFAITATDGAIGDVEQLYFDDEHWTVRYLIVNTGTWLAARQVLISPISVTKVDRAINQIFVNLTMDQVKNSPDIDTDKPVSRQRETAFMNYYGYPFYWAGPYAWGSAAYPAAIPTPPAQTRQMIKAAEAAQREAEATADEHLRSAREVTGYHLQAADGEVGHIEDFIIEDRSWAIRYLVVDTRNWLPGKKVLISPEWIERVSWSESKVFVDLPQEAIRNSPEYDRSSLFSRNYERRLHEHYGRRGYWDDEHAARR